MLQYILDSDIYSLSPLLNWYHLYNFLHSKFGKLIVQNIDHRWKRIHPHVENLQSLYLAIIHLFQILVEEILK